MLVRAFIPCPFLPVCEQIDLGTREWNVHRRRGRTDSSRNKAQMNGGDTLRIAIPEICRRISAPISSRSDKSPVAQDVMHQPMNEISGAPDAHPRVTRNIRVPIAGKRWHDDVKT